MHLRTFLLLSASGLGAHAAPSFSRQELESCLTGAVSGDASRAQFRHEDNYTTTDVKYYNLNYKYSPLAVVYPNSTAEISSALSCATKQSRKVQARSGGRDLINKCKYLGLGGTDDAIVVDLKHFDKISYDSSSQVATVGPSIRLRGLFDTLGAQDRCLPHGSFASIGVGGHAMVGGIGYLSRQHGLLVDNLLEVEVVLANGTVTRATKNQNQDLFWAMTGAGASFGIVTEFKFQTKPKPQEIVTFTYTYTSSDQSIISGAVKAYQKIIGNSTMSRKIGASGLLTNGSFSVSGAFFGTQSEFEAVNLESYLPAPTAKVTLPGQSWNDFFGAILTATGLASSQDSFYSRDTGLALDTVPTDEVIDQFVNYVFTSATVASWSFRFDLYGGAVNDIAVDATAFPHRNLGSFVTGKSSTGDVATSEAIMDFVDKGIETLQGNQPSKYLHYLGTPSKRHTSPQEKYWGSNLPRLQEIKSVLDPNDLFSTPQNVKPKST